MILNRINLIMGTALLVSFLALNQPAWSAGGGIEDRFIYTDYSKKISMDFKDVSLIEVLKIFSKESGKNFIAATDLSSKKITLFLDEVPLEEALNKILDANDLTYEVDPKSEVFIVKPKLVANNLITRVFALKNATVSSSKLNQSTGSSGSSSGVASSKGISDSIKDLLSKDGKIQEDSRTNSLIITDIPEQFPLIEEMINKLDVPIAQILIEVEMLDVSKVASDQIGIQYGNGGPFVQVTGAQRSSTFPFDEHLIERKAVDPTQVVTFTPTTNGYDFTGMTAALDFLKSQNDTRSLARPRILTLNNEPAHIEIGGDETTSVEVVTSAVGSSGAQTTSTVKKEKTSVILDVTPQANTITGDIVMKIAPEVDEAKSTQFKSNGAPVFDVEKRLSSSILKVKNGETIIIGGLLRSQTQNSVSKLPLLGDIPLIGAAFRHRTTTNTDRELVIFITPHILDEKFKQKLNDQSSRFLNREVNPQEANLVSQQLDLAEMDKR